MDEQYERNRQVWKDLVDSITQHPSTKPFKPMTVREEQLMAEVKHLRLELGRVRLMLEVLAAGITVPVAPDDADEELF